MDWIGITQITSGENVFFFKARERACGAGQIMSFWPLLLTNWWPIILLSLFVLSIWVCRSACVYLDCVWLSLCPLCGQVDLGRLLFRLHFDFLSESLHLDRQETWLSNVDVAVMWYGLKRYQGMACKVIWHTVNRHKHIQFTKDNDLHTVYSDYAWYYISNVDNCDMRLLTIWDFGYCYIIKCCVFLVVKAAIESSDLFAELNKLCYLF